MPNQKKSPPELAVKVIEELGGVTATARKCELKPASVFMWKKYGIPFAWEKLLRLEYPRLEAWKEN